MKILAAVICCDYKKASLNECLNSIKEAGITDVLLNYEGEKLPTELEGSLFNHIQLWSASGAGLYERKYDQDQAARLSRICIARNMCLDFAQSGGFDWILFVDSDVLIPQNAMELFTDTKPYQIRSGIVPGRGVHSHVFYIFHLKEQYQDGWLKAGHFTCGFMAIKKEVFWKLRFRWGEPVNGGPVASEDPLFGDDAKNILNVEWYGFRGTVARHVGELKNDEVSQF